MALPVPEGISNVNLPLPDPEAYPGEPREYARALMQRKDEIDQEVDRLHAVLASHNSDASTPLIDPEGYPRGDIDIYSIRHARSALARLATDRRTVTDRLSSALEAAFSPAGGSNAAPLNGDHPMNGDTNGLNGTNAGRTSTATTTEKEWPSSPVARVNSVAPGSPAAESVSSTLPSSPIADRAVRSVEADGGLQAIGAVVQRSEGVALELLVMRDGSKKKLSLTPRSTWGGRGSLGCHILPP